MKLYYILLFLAIGTIANGQRGPLSQIDDDWFWNIGSKGLKPGERVPEIPLGVDMNNPDQKVMASQFKGKLLILDFWSTTCSSCIEAFPKMEKLQKEFGDKIQIVLVNGYETADQIKSRLRGKNKLAMLPNLPMLVAETPWDSQSTAVLPVNAAFPRRGVPYHVWIGPDGVIKFMGGGPNTHAKKIRDYLDGKEVSFKASLNDIPSLAADKTTAYYQLLGDMKQTHLSTGSFITKFNNELFGQNREIIDSAKGLRIHYFINEDLLMIYLRGPYRDFYNSIENNFVYHPSRTGWEDFVVFDSSVDIRRFLAGGKYSGGNRTDEDYVKAQHCYELVTPLHVPEKTRRQFMLEDLNRFLAVEMGVIASLESRTLKCYSLVRSSKDNRIGTKESHVSLDFFIQQLINQHPSLQKSLPGLIQSEKLFIINETGFDTDMDVAIKPPAKELKTLSDLKKYLRAWGLELKKRKKTVDYLVFKKMVSN